MVARPASEASLLMVDDLTQRRVEGDRNVRRRFRLDGTA